MNRRQWLLLAGMIAVALNLRPAVASVAPVLETINTDLAISNTVASLLTTIPVICMGVFALVLPAITERSSRTQTIFWGTALIAVTIAARVGGRNLFVLFMSTILVSIGIGVTQAVLPALVTEYFPDRTAFATGLYTASMTGGAILATALTAPLAGRLSWPAALAVWAIPAGIALPIWLYATGKEPESTTGAPETDTVTGLPWRQRSAWVLVAVFGGATTTFFFILTWLAPRYVALGWSASTAGVLLTATLVTQTVSNVFVSAVGDRWHDRRPLFVLMIISFATGASGVTFVPLEYPYLWAVMLGIGSGGLFTLSMTLPILHAGTATETDGLTAIMLGFGYLMGALGPVAGGLLRDTTGSDTVMFGTFTLFSLCLLIPVMSIGTEDAGTSSSA
jgi:CP family cyanate transporter-like MFS transporter